jgi:hypothetical protein
MLILNSKHVQHVIDAYCQVWFQLAKLFQRRRLKYEKVNGRTDDGRQVMAIPHMALIVFEIKDEKY